MDKSFQLQQRSIEDYYYYVGNSCYGKTIFSSQSQQQVSDILTNARQGTFVTPRGPLHLGMIIAQVKPILQGKWFGGIVPHTPPHIMREFYATTDGYIVNFERGRLVSIFTPDIQIPINELPSGYQKMSDTQYPYHLGEYMLRFTFSNDGVSLLLYR